MTIQPTDVKTGYVTTEGDELYYEVRGHGEPLLMIHGGGGDAGMYAYVAEILCDEYTVITYDRRGNSRSTGNDPQNFEISQHSRDAVAVLRAAGETSAYIFGNSSGATIALDIAKTQSQAVKAVIAHEPPIFRVLPDREKWLRYFASLLWMSYRFGVSIAMLRFALSLGIPFKAMGKTPRDAATRMDHNHDYFMKHEMLPIVNYKPDIAAIKNNRVRACIAVGKMSLDKKLYYAKPAPILARMLGSEMIVFPGHHISYQDMPVEWAATLRNVVRKAAEPSSIAQLQGEIL